MPGNTNIFSRRDFLGKTASTAMGISAASLINNSSVYAKQGRKRLRIALVGTGGRGSGTWGRNLIHTYKDYVDMVGLCDPNKLRVEVAKKIINTDAPTFTDFDEMVKQTKPDTVIITTVDAYHGKYAVRAMELGCDVICEKPMATDEVQTQAILDTEKKTGKKVIVTFNARYGQTAEHIKEILLTGEIGRIVSVDFDWYLDVYHGASYFRRWHGIKNKSGTLLVHKATHHFDMMNWWIDSEPVEIFAYGKLEKYGRNGTFRGKNCRACLHKEKCPFYWDITKDSRAMELYVACESEDGYYRDGCIFRNQIDIYDTMALNVKYNSDIHMTYSLNAFMPYEGYRVGFNGLNGRLDIKTYSQQPWEDEPRTIIRLTKNFGESRLIEPRKAGSGGHGGADPKLKDMIFKENVPDPLNQKAGSRAGAMSILIGISAYHSIEQKRPIKINELVKFA